MIEQPVTGAIHGSTCSFAPIGQDEPERGWENVTTPVSSRPSQEERIYKAPLFAPLDENSIAEPWHYMRDADMTTSDWVEVWKMQSKAGRYPYYATRMYKGKPWHSIGVTFESDKCGKRVWLKPVEALALKDAAQEIVTQIYNVLKGDLPPIEFKYARNEIEDLNNYHWSRDLLVHHYRHFRIGLRVYDASKPEESCYIYIYTLTMNRNMMVSRASLRLSEFVEVICAL